MDFAADGKEFIGKQQPINVDKFIIVEETISELTVEDSSSMHGWQEVVHVDASDEVGFVMDSLAGETFIPDSQCEDEKVHGNGESFSDKEVDATSALMHLHATEVSTFDAHGELEYVFDGMDSIISTSTMQSQA